MLCHSAPQFSSNFDRGMFIDILAPVLRSLFFKKFNEAQKNMPNHYLKLEVLKLHLVVMYGSSECMGKTFQAATTNT